MIEFQKRLDNLEKKVDEIYEILKYGKQVAEPEFKGLISQADAIKKYQFSKDWFWRRRKTGELPIKKLGGRVYFEQNDLLNLLKDPA